MYNVPCNKDLLQASDIPFAVVITSFAELPANEVSLVLFLVTKWLKYKVLKNHSF